MIYVGYIIVGVITLVAGFIIGRLAAERSTARTIGELEGLRARSEDELARLRDDQKQQNEKIDQLNEDLSDRQAKLADLASKMQEREKSFAEQKANFEKAREQLQETFKALAADSLESTSSSFLKLAQEKLSAVMNQARGDLGKQKDQIELLVKPLQQTLSKYEQQLREIESTRKQAYGGLEKHLKMLGDAQAELQDRTGKLTSALRNPQTRGRWGELTLQRTVELAGMTEHCDFDTQVSADGPTGRLRPDMVVHMPGRRDIVVDAKVPCEDYLNAVEATEEAVRKAALNRYAQTIRRHVQQLGGKSYWEQFGPDRLKYVVLFLPGESFFSAAMGVDHELIEHAMQNRIIIASPTILITLLRAVELGWREEKLAQSANEIREISQDLYERVVNFADHLTSLGRNLDNTVASYNNAIGSFQHRILPAGRKLNSLGITAKRELPDPKIIDRRPRKLPDTPRDEQDGRS